MDIEHVSAVVTGGVSGLGEAVARALVAAGAKVSLFDVNAEQGEIVAKKIGAFFVLVDVTSDASVDAGFAQARDHHGQERILINCAGVAPARRTVSRDRATGAIRRHPMDAFDKTIQINLVGSFRCVAAAAAGMAALDPIGADGERGVIINTASVAAQDGQIGQAAYSASKGGVAAMTLTLARDLMSEGIRVNAVLPGIMKTPMLTAMPAPVQASLGESVPFPKRLGEPSEFADLVLAMIRNGYLNGENIRLDGAIRMRPS